MTTDKPSPVAGPASEPAPLHHIINMRWAYEQACDLADWANANGTTLGNDEKLYQAAIKLRDTLGKATHAAQPVPAPAVDERTADSDSGHLAAAPEQHGELPEPVAWRYKCAGWERWIYCTDPPRNPQHEYIVEPLYASPPPAQPPQNPWRDAIDEALVVAHLGVATEPYDDLNRLLEWHHDVWLDPAVSSDAQALIDRGAAEERQRTAQPAQAEFHNPWRTSLENCISGDNYLRASEYRDLIEELDELYRLRAAQPPREPVQPLSDTVSVCKTDANNYCRILTALGMEEEGDPVAEIERLITERMSAGGKT